MEGKEFPLSPTHGSSIEPKSFRAASASEGRVPLQYTVPSASAMPWQPQELSLPSYTPSPRYVEQFNALMERQRQVFDEERALWATERADLLRRIAGLEVQVQCSSISSQASTLSGVTTSEQKGDFGSSIGNTGSRHTSSSSDGNKVWNPQPSQPPRRVFSESTSHGSSKPPNRLASIDENAHQGKMSSLSETSSSKQTPGQPLHHKTSISGHLLSKDLDGIQFKASGLPPSVVRAVLEPQSNSNSSSSSTQSPVSPSHVSPNTAPSPSRETPPRELSLPRHLDPYLKDAGHTPLVRGTQTMPSLDGSEDNSGGSTPTHPEVERPPLEPTASLEQVPKAPRENKDSYFPTIPQTIAENEDTRGTESTDEDPVLEGPLGLTGDPEGERNKTFMRELDKKLSSVNLREASGIDDSKSPPSASNSSSLLSPQSQHTDTQSGEENQVEQPEDEPRLRMKTSMNFGSAFGAKDCGKGFGFSRNESK